MSNMTEGIQMDKFTAAYIEAALWSSTDDVGEPLDNGEHELAPETRAKMASDCAKFQAEQAGRGDRPHADLH